MNISINNTSKEDPIEIKFLPAEDKEFDISGFWAVSVGEKWVCSPADKGQYPEGQRWLALADTSDRVLCLSEEQAIELRDGFISDLSKLQA